MQKHKVFVYGTLKRGFSNHYYLADAKFIGNATTKEKYAMYEDFGIPFVYKDEKVSHIKGEVYEVDDATLSAIDHLEGHPEVYKRELVKVILENGEEIDAWIYFYPEKRGKLNPSGEFKG